MQKPPFFKKVYILQSITLDNLRQPARGGSTIPTTEASFKLLVVSMITSSAFPQMNFALVMPGKVGEKIDNR